VDAWKVVRALMVTYVLVFIVYPLVNILLVTFSNGLQDFVNFFSNGDNIKFIFNSLFVSACVSLLTLILGAPIAYFFNRYRVPFKDTLLSLLNLPIMLPPFVGALAYIYLLGNFGTINLLLLQAKLIRRPINFIYGLHGLILIQTLSYFPIVVLNTYSGLSKIDRSLEEASESLGAMPLRRFIDVTLPLVAPSILTGALLVFVMSLADYATPLVLGVYQLLAPQAFLNVIQAIDEARVRLGIVTVTIIMLMSISSLLLFKKYISLREYATLRVPRPVEEHVLKGLKKVLVYAVIFVPLALSLVPHAMLILMSVSKNWSFTPFPTQYSLENYIRAFTDAEYLSSILHSVEYSLIALGIDFVVGVFTAYLLVRTSNPLNDLIDSFMTLMLATPGLVVGTSWLLAFHNPVPFLNFKLTDLWLILPLMLATRRLPYLLRSSYATLLQIRQSTEEASLSLGAPPMRTFAKITVPLILEGVVTGLVFTFITAMNELTASLFLYKPGWETITIMLFTNITMGEIPMASTLGAILVFLILIATVVSVKYGRSAR